MCKNSQPAGLIQLMKSWLGQQLQQHTPTTHLVWVSHHEQVAAWSCDLSHQLKLAQVGVLALINKHMAPATVKLSTDLQENTTALLMSYSMYAAHKMPSQMQTVILVCGLHNDQASSLGVLHYSAMIVLHYRLEAWVCCPLLHCLWLVPSAFPLFSHSLPVVDTAGPVKVTFRPCMHWAQPSALPCCMQGMQCCAPCGRSPLDYCGPRPGSGAAGHQNQAASAISARVGNGQKQRPACVLFPLPSAQRASARCSAAQQ
jgi:hypothetical protein